MVSRIILSLAAVLLSSALVPHAAITYMTTEDGSTVTIHTGTSGGQCLVTPLGGGDGTDVECYDGNGNSSRANTIQGCMETSGTGLCAKGHWGPGTMASGQLNCDNNVSYNLSTGNDEGTCTRGPDSMTCDDGDNPRNAATASCSGGCGDTHGSGCCCKASTSGCGPGKNCTGG